MDECIIYMYIYDIHYNVQYRRSKILDGHITNKLDEMDHLKKY